MEKAQAYPLVNASHIRLALAVWKCSGQRGQKQLSMTRTRRRETKRWRAFRVACAPCGSGSRDAGDLGPDIDEGRLGVKHSCAGRTSPCGNSSASGPVRRLWHADIDNTWRTGRSDLIDPLAWFRRERAHVALTAQQILAAGRIRINDGRYVRV